eukprot:14871189-Ditylum_brightwellii.AAC.1
MKLSGLSIFITHPITLWAYCIPMALTPLIRESAVELSATTMMGLECIRVEMEVLYITDNDNCTTAMKAGQITIGADQGDDGQQGGRCQKWA